MKDDRFLMADEMTPSQSILYVAWQAPGSVRLHGFNLNSCPPSSRLVQTTATDCLQTVQSETARLFTRSNRWSHISLCSQVSAQAPASVPELLQPCCAAHAPGSNPVDLLSVPRTCLKTEGAQALSPGVLCLHPHPLLIHFVSLKRGLKSCLFHRAVAWPFTTADLL